MIRVFVVDDSAIVRQKLTKELNKYSDIQVIGTAIDPYVARDKIVKLDPDVITLDVEMPRMDGITFLKRIMRYFPKPVIIVSSLTEKGSSLALEAIEAGAIEVMCKPGGAYSVGDLSMQLANIIRAASKADIKKKDYYSYKTKPKKKQKNLKATPGKKKTLRSSKQVIAMGASTGGTEAIKQILLNLPADTPGILIVQHMPPQFTRTFAERLNSMCAMDVKEAEDGDKVMLGHVLIAPGNYHMLLRKSGAQYHVSIKDGPMVHHQRPSIDVLMRSVAQKAGKNAIGALLTGMGSDGAQGLLEMKKARSMTMVQNKESCVVFGMPQEALKIHAADLSLDINDMASAILRKVKQLQEQ